MSDYLQTVFDKFELRVRKGCFYTEDDLWIKIEEGKVRVGVTDYLQRTSGDIAFVEVAKQGSRVDRRSEIGTVETAKTTLQLLSPISGTVLEINGLLSGKPELVNSDPYGDGWLVVLEPESLESDSKGLLNAEDYFKLMSRRLSSNDEKLESR